MNFQLIGTVDDLAPHVDPLLDRANELARGATSRAAEGRVVGLAFLEPSLRTRVGFAIAAARLGGSSVGIDALRQTASASAEPWTETLRVLSGMVDLVVARPGVPFDPMVARRWSVCPVINGGDTGSRAEHPTQALVDLFAMEQMVGPVAGLVVALCGDLRSRSARSLLRLLTLRPPRRLVVITAADFGGAPALPAALATRTEERRLPDVDDIDVMCAVGMPGGDGLVEVRRRLQVDDKTLERLPRHAVVLSPMPVLDEIKTTSLGDPRIRVYEQSDLGVFVRMAVLERLLLDPR